jgi:hypothetical protein
MTRGVSNGARGGVLDEFGDPFGDICLGRVSGERKEAEACVGHASQEPRRLSSCDEIERTLREQNRAGDPVEIARDIRTDGPHEQPPELRCAESDAECIRGQSAGLEAGADELLVQAA